MNYGLHTMRYVKKEDVAELVFRSYCKVVTVHWSKFLKFCNTLFLYIRDIYPLLLNWE